MGVRVGPAEDATGAGGLVDISREGAGGLPAAVFQGEQLERKAFCSLDRKIEQLRLLNLQQLEQRLREDFSTGNSCLSIVMA